MEGRAQGFIASPVQPTTDVNDKQRVPLGQLASGCKTLEKSSARKSNELGPSQAPGQPPWRPTGEARAPASRRSPRRAGGIRLASD